MSNKLKISGVVLDFDVLDADTLERSEAAMQTVLDKIAQIPAEMPEPDKIRRLCGAVKNCFDEIFGAGTAEKLFGAANNLNLCVTAFEQLAQSKRAQEAAWAKRMDRSAASLAATSE